MNVQRIVVAVFLFLFCLSNYVVTGVRAEDSIVLSTFPDTSAGYLMTIPGNLKSHLTTSAAKISTRKANFSDTKLKISSIAFDPGNQTLFIHDLATRSISRVNYFTSWLNDTRLNLTVLHTGVSFVESQVAYDWWNQNLYWTDGIYKWIVIQPANTYDGLMYKVMVSHNLYKPMALAVDPTNGYLFWSDIAPNPKIEMSSLSGESRRTLVSSSIKNPISLAADETTQGIYWTDSSRYTIETCSYSGQNRRVIRRLSGTQLQSVALHNDIVCATDPKNRRITCFRTSSGALTLTLSGFQSTPWALALYDSSPRTTQTSPCRAKSCENICVTSSNVAQCMCKEGYTLNQDGKTCSHIHGLFSKGIMLSNTSHICMFEIRIISGKDHDLSCVHHITGNISHIQSDGRKSLIFYAYSDNSNRDIRIHDRVTLKTTPFVITSLVSGLAYDWVNDYLYWSESDTGRIRGISMTTKFTFTVYNNIGTPTGLTIDPYGSTLYWIATVSSGKAIQSGTTDGSNKRTVIGGSNSNNSSTLHFDTEDNRLYWINSGSLRSCRPNGTDITYHFWIGNSNHLFIYKKYIIWTTDQLELRTSRLSGSNAEVTKSVASMGSITEMTVFDAALQRQEKSACEVANGRCEQICVTNQASRICECSLGFQLQADQTSCDSAPFDDHFLLITDYNHGKVYQISLVNISVVALKLPRLRSPVGIAYNHISRQLVWSEIETGKIRQSTLSGKNATIIYTLGFAFADRLTIDFSSGNIYFSEISQLGLGGSIRIVRNGASPKTVVTNLNSPRAISLYPSKGLMFYTDHATNNSHITRSNMDGSSKKTIVSVSTKWPNGLTIDYLGNRIYWTDGYHDKIESTDLNGGYRQELAVDNGAHLMSLVLDGSYLYYTAWSKQIITKLNNNTGQQETWMSHTAEFGRLDSLDIYPGETQPVNTLCSINNGQCSTYCLPTASGRVCACEDGVNLKSDGRTCVGVTHCPLSIQNGNLDSSCLRYVGNICSYECLPEYRKNQEHDDIICEIGGIWNVPLHHLCILIQCPLAIPNGQLVGSCDRHVDEKCDYRCDPEYERNNKVKSLQCSISGQWDESAKKACEGNETESTSAPPTNTVNIGAIGGGLAGGGLIIVLILVVIRVCRKRRGDRNKSYTEQKNIISTTDSISQFNDKDVNRKESGHYAYINDTTMSLLPQHHCLVIPADRQINPYEDDGYITPLSISNANNPYSDDGYITPLSNSNTNNLQSFNNPAFSTSELYPVDLAENKSHEYINTALFKQETELSSKLNNKIRIPEVQSNTAHLQPPMIPPKSLNPPTFQQEMEMLPNEFNSKILTPEVHSDTVYKKPPIVPPKPLMQTNENIPYELTKKKAEDNAYTLLTTHKDY